MNEIKVTFFRGFTQVTEQRSFKETMGLIKSGHWAVRVAPIRKLSKEGKKEECDKLKRGLPAFTSCAQYDEKRRWEYLIFYNGLPVLDIDDLSDADVIRLKKIIIGCSYTLACFVSPSGNGLKVFVRVSTGVEDHLNTFLCLVQYFEVLLGVKIDTSGKDVSRLCFVSDDKELYYNENAEVFVPYSGGKDCQTWTEAPKPDLPILKSGNVIGNGTWPWPSAWSSPKSSTTRSLSS